MKLTKVDWREIGETYKRTKWDEVIDEFLLMDTEAVEVTEYSNKSATSCHNAIMQAIKRKKAYRVTAKVRNGKVYLINQLLIQKHKED